MKKIILILLLLSLIVPATASCGDDSGTTNTTERTTDSENISLPNGDNSAAEEIQQQKPKLDLPDVKYDGAEFRVMNIDQSGMSWVYTTIVAEEETGEGINDAVYRRNSLVEERFDIVIKEIVERDEGTISSKASRSIRAGSDDYDLFMLSSNEAARLANQQMLMDYNEIRHIDLSQPWWDRDMARDLSYGGRNYLITGDFSMTHYGDTIAMFFNKKLLNDMALESPYNIINEGKWTYNKFWEISKDASRDLDGDGAFTKDDQYGYMSLTHIWTQGFMAAAGQYKITKDNNGMHAFAMNNEKFIQVYQRMIEIMHDGNMTFDADTAGDHRLQDIMFPNNQALFWSEVSHWATILRDMDADFGIIIHPKWDETQTGYYNYVYPPPVMCVPSTTPEIERTGMILEALCYESTDTVIKAYYDVLLKTKVSRDNESEKMLDIMFQNRFYDLAAIYYNNEIHSSFVSSSKNKNIDIVSWIEKNENRISAAIEKNNNTFVN